MSEAIVPTTEAVERVVLWIRQRLEAAAKNGQRVDIHVREDSERLRVPESVFNQQSFAEMFSHLKHDGGMTLTIRIEPRS